jgi:solute carrier family 34 (sodium-dependent phosphate cotransporter)
VIGVTDQEIEQHKPGVRHTVLLIVYILLAFLLFFFALHLLESSFEQLGSETINSIISTVANPFTGFFIGLIITAMIQSSSTTTAFVVGLVATNSLTLENGIPIIMGANVGTTITALIVSLAYISKKKEFRRAVGAGSYHCFFNLLTLLVLFPLEYYYHFLSRISFFLADSISGPAAVTPTSAVSASSVDSLTNSILTLVPNLLAVVLLAFLLLFASIVLFRRVISNLLKARSPEAFSRFVFKGKIKALGWGLVTTAAIRSSTITTSVVVPIVAKKIATLREAAPFIMGANLGTTITGFIALLFNINSTAALSIAIAHFLFNLIGVLLFYPIPTLAELPLSISSALGKLSARNRIAIFAFVLSIFFLIPSLLIFLTIS